MSSAGHSPCVASIPSTSSLRSAAADGIRIAVSARNYAVPVFIFFRALVLLNFFIRYILIFHSFLQIHLFLNSIVKNPASILIIKLFRLFI